MGFTLPGFKKDDKLIFEIWDKDDEKQNEHADIMAAHGTSQSDWEAQQVFACRKGNEMLGTAILGPIDIATHEPQELALQEAGPGIKATLTVQANVVTLWPDLKGVFKDEAARKVQEERNDLEVQLFETP